MSIIEAVSEAVSAKQAAELYGLKFDRRGSKAICPWHSDRHPSLSFKGKKCKCFACNNGGDAVDITAQILGVSLIEAAQRLQRDFGVGVPVDRADIKELRAKQQAREKAKADSVRRYCDLCDIETACGQALQAYDKETAWDNPEFVRTLRLFAEAQDLLNGWYDMNE